MEEEEEADMPARFLIQATGGTITERENSAGGAGFRGKAKKFSSGQGL